MKDRKLVLIIMGIVGFDIVLFIVFTILDPMEISKIDTDQTVCIKFLKKIIL